MKDENNKGLKIALVLAFLMVCIALFWFIREYDTYNTIKRQHERKIEKLNDKVDSLQKSNEVLFASIGDATKRIDSIKQQQRQNQIDYENAKIQIRNWQSSFADLDDDSMDSVMRAYIRANQKPFRN